MGNSGSGGRTDWKDKIDRTSWVDNTPWANADSDTDEESVEFLETEPSAFRLDRPTAEVSESLLSSSTSRLLALGAVGVVLVALAIMSRPGSGDPFDQLPTARQQEILERRAQDQEDDGATPAPEESGVDDAAGEAADDKEPTENDGDDVEPATAAPPPPIPRLRSDLPAEVSGSLFMTGTDGSLVSVAWAEMEIEEALLPIEIGVAEREVSALQLIGQEVIMLTEGQLLQLTDDGVESSAAEITELLPTDGGLAVVAVGSGGMRTAFFLPADGREPPESVIERQVNQDLQPVGRWGDRLLAEKAGKIWLMDQDGPGGQVITDGQLLSFDGVHLVVLRCADLLSCRIEVGPPDQPNRFVVPVPEVLQERNPSTWGRSATVSPDGQRLAIVDDVGAFTAPIAIDLLSGEVTVGTDIVNGDSPLAWSPEGRFLSYAFGDDLVLWDRENDDRYRIDIDRQIDLMLWAPDPVDS